VNRTERNELAREVRRLVRDVKLSVEAFRDAAERLLEKENDKLADMPESLSTSRNASRCEDAVEMLDDALENAMSLVDATCEIAQVCNVDVTKGRISESIPCMASYESRVDETKSARLQLLVWPSLLEFLRIESRDQGCSVNQLVNDILVQAFKAR
jgi:DNA polymerase III alpha subunit